MKTTLLLGATLGLTLLQTSFADQTNSQQDQKSHWGKRGYDIPTIDLDQRTDLQIIVDKEKGQYLGHPTTLLLEDGKTVLCVYPKGHGKGPIVYKKSLDGGKTWSERLPTPKSWATSKEVPTLYSVTDPQGKTRQIMFSGGQPRASVNVRMSISEDNGKTWSELKEIGDYKGVVAMADCIALKKPGHYLATLHVPTFDGKGPKKRTVTLQTVKSIDGGLTWSKPRDHYASAETHLCEAGLVKSPDGSEIAMLLRENTRRKNSHIMFSRDEGETWTAPKELPGALSGDRHQAVYLPDGRLLIQFRDRAPFKSATRGDWIGWVGTYADLKNGREGQYRIRFKDNKAGSDSTYPAAELLPDGTLLCTTYGHWEKRHKPYILSFRFKISEIDKLAKTKQGKLKNQGSGNDTYDPDSPDAINKKQ